jgi:hypothetical protein
MRMAYSVFIVLHGTNGLDLLPQSALGDLLAAHAKSLLHAAGYADNDLFSNPTYSDLF